MDSCVYDFKLKFILKARMDRLTDMCKIRKHTVVSYKDEFFKRSMIRVSMVTP